MKTSALKSFALTVRRQLFMPVNNQKFTGTLGLSAGLTTTDRD